MIPLRVMLTLAPDRLDRLPAMIRAARRAGIDAVGIGDSPRFAETYVALTVAATADTGVAVGPMVTNLRTRTPQVTAQALATLEQLAPGRVFAGIGAGDSALVPTGQAPPGPDAFAAGLQTLRTEWPRATAAGTAGTSDCRPPRQLIVAANGPRMIAAGCRAADILVTGTGIDPDTLARTATTVTVAATTAGRSGRVGHWCVARVAVQDDTHTAVRELLPLLASGANHVFASPTERRLLDPGVRTSVEALRRHYDYRSHGARDANRNAALVVDLGLTAALTARFALAGDPGSVAAGLVRLGTAGLGGVVIPAVGLDVDRLIARLGAEVFPELRRLVTHAAAAPAPPGPPLRS